MSTVLDKVHIYPVSGLLFAHRVFCVQELVGFQMTVTCHTSHFSVNTSMLQQSYPTWMTSSLQDPEKFYSLFFFSPDFLMAVIQIS